MDMRKLVGRNFARLRREKGFTQERFAEAAGFTQQYVSGLVRPFDGDPEGGARVSGAPAWCS